jgi:hypothetical protein
MHQSDFATNLFEDALSMLYEPARKLRMPVDELRRRNLGLVSLRLQQASAQGTQPDLLGLLADESWRRELGREFNKPYMAKLETFLHQEWASHKVFPPQNLIFRCISGRHDFKPLVCVIHFAHQK